MSDLATSQNWPILIMRQINGRTKRETLYWLKRSRRNQQTFRPHSAAWTMNLDVIKILKAELAEHMKAEVMEE